MTEAAQTREELARQIAAAFDVEPWVIGLEPMPRRPLRRWLRWKARGWWWRAYYALHPAERGWRRV